MIYALLICCEKKHTCILVVYKNVVNYRKSINTMNYNKILKEAIQLVCEGLSIDILTKH